MSLLLPGRVGLRTTSHSLKCTCLSFAAKFGISHQDRLVLGGHAHTGRMADVYARDAMARPLRLLSEVLEAIRVGTFLPDAHRAGRFLTPSLPSSFSLVAPCEPIAQPDGSHRSKSAKRDMEVVEVKSDPPFSPHSPAGTCLNSNAHPQSPLPAEDTSSDSSGTQVTSSNSESSSSSDSDVGSLAARAQGVPEPGPGFKFVQHSKLGTLHLLKDYHHKFTICGRKVVPPLEGQPLRIKRGTPVCRNCRRAQSQV